MILPPTSSRVRRACGCRGSPPTSQRPRVHCCPRRHQGGTSAAIFGCPAHEVDCEGGGGLQIFVTVDLEIQEAANRILQTWLPVPDSSFADPRGAPTGAIAMVEKPHRSGPRQCRRGLPFEQEQFDLAIQGRRNPGSAFKPFVLAAYLESGGSLQSYWMPAARSEIECEDPCGPDGSYIWDGA